MKTIFTSCTLALGLLAAAGIHADEQISPEAAATRVDITRNLRPLWRCMASGYSIYTHRRVHNVAIGRTLISARQKVLARCHAERAYCGSPICRRL